MMSRSRRPVLLTFLGIMVSLSGVWASEYIESTLETDLVPGPVEYSVLLPDGYAPDAEPLRVLATLSDSARDRAGRRGIPQTHGG